MSNSRRFIRLGVSSTGTSHPDLAKRKRASDGGTRLCYAARRFDRHDPCDVIAPTFSG